MTVSVSGMVELEGERLSLEARDSFRLSRGSGFRLAMRACAIEFVSMLLLACRTGCLCT